MKCGVDQGPSFLEADDIQIPWNNFSAFLLDSGLLVDTPCERKRNDPTDEAGSTNFAMMASAEK